MMTLPDAEKYLLLHAYPTLHAEGLANAWAHQDEIEQQIRENEAA